MVFFSKSIINVEKSSEPYEQLFKRLMEHIRQAGMIPWQNEKYK